MLQIQMNVKKRQQKSEVAHSQHFENKKYNIMKEKKQFLEVQLQECRKRIKKIYISNQLIKQFQNTTQNQNNNLSNIQQSLNDSTSILNMSLRSSQYNSSNKTYTTTGLRKLLTAQKDYLTQVNEKKISDMKQEFTVEQQKQILKIAEIENMIKQYRQLCQDAILKMDKKKQQKQHFQVEGYRFSFDTSSVMAISRKPSIPQVSETNSFFIPQQFSQEKNIPHPIDQKQKQQFLPLQLQNNKSQIQNSISNSNKNSSKKKRITIHLSQQKNKIKVAKNLDLQTSITKPIQTEPLLKKCLVPTPSFSLLRQSQQPQFLINSKQSEPYSSLYDDISDSSMLFSRSKLSGSISNRGSRMKSNKSYSKIITAMNCQICFKNFKPHQYFLHIEKCKDNQTKNLLLKKAQVQQQLNFLISKINQ